MALTASNTIFVYRDGDADSLAVAQYYQQKRGLSINNLVVVPCSVNEVLSDYATFQSEVENPIKVALAAPPLDTEDIYVIVLGHNVPGGFYDGVDIVSSVSRIMVMDSPYSIREQNFFYLRKVGTDYSATDNSYGYIVGRIDSPSVKISKQIIDRSIEIENQRTVNGDLYIDPYFGISGSGYKEYSDSLVRFVGTKAAIFNMPLHMTILEDPYKDAVFACLSKDSFYWGGLSDYATSDLFLYSNSMSRVFFFNVDNISATTVRSTTDNYWVPVVIESGYMSAAGAMSSILPSDFLSIDAFFSTLKNGNTLGEAFAYSLPRVNSFLTLIGDPLTTINFPDYANDENILPNNLCSFFATESPYAIDVTFRNINIGDNCLTDSITGDKTYLKTFNFTLNKTHTLSFDLSSGCTWIKTIPNALSAVRWFAPITNSDPCNNIPSNSSEGEVVNYDIEIKLTFSRMSSSNNVYTMTLSVGTAKKDLGYAIKPENYIMLFESSQAVDLNAQGLIGSYFGNDYTQVKESDGNFIFAQDGFGQITNVYYINGTNSDIEDNGIPDYLTGIKGSLTGILKAISYSVAKQDLTYNAFITVVYGSDVSEAVDLTYVTEDLSNSNSEEARTSVFYGIVDSFIRFMTFSLLDEYNIRYSSNRQSITINEALELKDLQVSREFSNIVGGDTDSQSDVNRIIAERNILNDGTWAYETTLLDRAGGVADYHFELDVATDSGFSNIVYSFDSSTDTCGWLYETGTDNQGNKQFNAVPSSGVSYAYLGKVIRFESPSDKTLTTNSIYYFRLRQKTTSTTYAFVTNYDIVYA